MLLRTSDSLRIAHMRFALGAAVRKFTNTAKSSDDQQESFPFRRRIRINRDYYNFSRTRPLPQVPWMQDTRKTYLDDAERMFGPKGEWYLKFGSSTESTSSADHSHEEDVNHHTRMNLIMILRRFLQDTNKSSRELFKLCNERSNKLKQLSAEYAGYAAAASMMGPSALENWRRPRTAAELIRERYERKTTVNSDRLLEPKRDVEVNSKGKRSETGSENSDISVIENTLTRHTSEQLASHGDSQFPFLRQRALFNPKDLDESLLDWTRSVFPNDSPDFIAPPPDEQLEVSSSEQFANAETDIDKYQLDNEINKRNSTTAAGREESEVEALIRRREGRQARRMAARAKVSGGSNKLRSSLVNMFNKRIVPFDSDGIYYNAGKKQVNSNPQKVKIREQPRTFRIHNQGELKQHIIGSCNQSEDYPSGKRRRQLTRFLDDDNEPLLNPAQITRAEEAVKLDWRSAMLLRKWGAGHRGPKWHRAQEKLIRMSRGDYVE